MLVVLVLLCILHQSGLLTQAAIPRGSRVSNDSDAQDLASRDSAEALAKLHTKTS